MVFIAQTNLQLLNQLRDLGYSEADQILVARAYGLATQVFTGYFRGSGKPFLAHLVGTASILAAQSVAIEVVLTGLLHAVYSFGGSLEMKKVSSRQRARVNQVVGSQVEQYIAYYTELDWHEQTIPHIAERLPQMGDVERQILLVQLANELEDHWDLGVLYCRNLEKRLHYVRQYREIIATMALQLGFPVLAEQLDQVFQATLSAQIPDSIRSPHEYSYLVPTIPYWRYRLRKLRASIHYRLQRVRFQQKNPALS